MTAEIQTSPPSSPETIIAFKATRPDGTDYRTGSVRYDVGTTVEVEGCDPPEEGPCGRGLHVSPQPRQTCRYINRSLRGARARFFEVHIQPQDVIARGSDKLRVSKLHVAREVAFEEVFPGLDTEGLRQRVEAVRAEMATWKQFPWLKPARLITEDDVKPLLARWYDALSRWLPPGVSLPRRARIVRKRDMALAAADADAGADEIGRASWRERVYVLV